MRYALSLVLAPHPAQNGHSGIYGLSGGAQERIEIAIRLPFLLLFVFRVAPFRSFVSSISLYMHCILFH